MAVRIRMKQMGRTHRHFYRIVAIDHRQPRDGKVIEELGEYNPHATGPDGGVKLLPARIKYWQSVGAIPTEHCAAIFKKHMKKWEQAEVEEAAKAKAAAAPAAPAQA